MTAFIWIQRKVISEPPKQQKALKLQWCRRHFCKNWNNNNSFPPSSCEQHSSPTTEGGEQGGGGSPVGAGAGFSDVSLGGSPPPRAACPGLTGIPLLVTLFWGNRRQSHSWWGGSAHAAAGANMLVSAEVPTPFPNREENRNRDILFLYLLCSCWLRCNQTKTKGSLCAVSQPSVTITGAKRQLGRLGRALGILTRLQDSCWSVSPGSRTHHFQDLNKETRKL